MVFQPGQSGNPGGKFKDKPLTDALRLEITKPSDFAVHKRSARALARALLDKACKGDALAYREVADRLEGRTAAVHTHGQHPELAPIQIVVTGVPRQIEDTKTIDVTPDPDRKHDARRNGDVPNMIGRLTEEDGA